MELVRVVVEVVEEIIVVEVEKEVEFEEGKENDFLGRRAGFVGMSGGIYFSTTVWSWFWRFFYH
jgi:hypothetical protein